jgi:hypothetical protein
MERPLRPSKPEVAQGAGRLDRLRLVLSILAVAACLAMLGVATPYALAGVLALLYGESGRMWLGALMCAGAPLVTSVPMAAFVLLRRASGRRRRIAWVAALLGVSLAGVVGLGWMLGPALEALR